MYQWLKFKEEYRKLKGELPIERIRQKFYRAMNIYKKMACHSKEYMKGYFDGAGVDQETRGFIEFISK
jgi:hypothetical protein